MADESVAVPFVEQEQLYYCGPATLQMVCSALGVASPATPPSWQDQLWLDVQANTGAMRPPAAPSTPTSPAFPQQKCEWCKYVGWRCWSTTPTALEDLANTLQSVAQFATSVHKTEEGATDALMDSIDAKVPAFALVWGWQHWLVVDGYRHGEAGATPVGGRNLNGVFIRNPLEEAATANHYVDWDTWESDYLKFVPCGDYEGSFVVIGGVRRQGKQPPAPPNAPTGLRVIDALAVQRLRLRLVRKVVPTSTAIESARAAAIALRGSVRLGQGFDGAEATRALLVQRIDEHDRYYYIVTFESGGRETARVIVDARDGRAGEVSAITEKGLGLPRYITAEEGRNRWLSVSDRDSSSVRYRVRQDTIGAHPVPVWKPCRQSSSPFQPFWQYSVGDSFVYTRFDGSPFDGLTEGPA